MIELEKALIKQIVTAIPSMSPKSFCNRYNNAIDQPLPTIFASLFQDHCRVENKTIKK